MLGEKESFFFFLNESMWLHQILVTATQDQHFVVQSLSRVRLFVTLWRTACQASMSFTVSWSLLKLMSIVSVISIMNAQLILATVLCFVAEPSCVLIVSTNHEAVFLS